MRRYNNSVITATGTAVAGALVVVKVAATPPGTGALATIYSDDGITLAANPLIADAFGRFGFNAPNGRYDLVVSGPNLITFVMAGEEITDFLEFQAGKDQQPTTGAIVSSPSSPQTTHGALNGIQIVDSSLFRGGSDIGDEINKAYAALPGGGGEIYITAGSYFFSTPIVITGGSKQVKITGAGSPGTLLNWTATSGTALTIDHGIITGNEVTLEDFTLNGISTTGTTTGVSVGPNLGAKNSNLSRLVIQGFQVPLAANSLFNRFTNLELVCNSATNSRGMTWGTTADSGVVSGGTISSCITNVDMSAVSNGPLTMFGTLMFGGTTYLLNTNTTFNCFGCHFTNGPGSNLPTWFNIGSGSPTLAINLFGGTLEDDRTSGVLASYAQASSGSVSIMNMEIGGTATATASEVVLLSGNATASFVNNFFTNSAINNMYNTSYTGGLVVEIGTSGGTTPINYRSNQALNLASTTFSGLGSAANGTLVYCSDCTLASPCAGGGTGALAKRLNSVWACN